MQEELPEHAIVSSNEQCVVKGSVIVENSTDTHIGPKYIFVYPSADKEIELRPELLDINGVNKTPFQDKTDKNNEVCIVEESKLRIRKLYVLIGGIVIAIISTVAILAAVYATPQTDPEPDIGDENSTLKIIDRGEWFALPTTETIPKLSVTPAPYIVVFEAGPSFCKTKTVCSNYVRFIQAGHLQLDYGDIGYHFMIGGDGAAYKGRGWDLHGAHTLILNNRSISIAFIGFYEYEKPLRKQMTAFHKLIKIGIENNKLLENYKIFTHKDIYGSASIGKRLYNIIITLPHYRMYNSTKDIPPYGFD